MTTRDQLIRTVSRNDPAAVEFLTAVVDIAHLWDDLVDRDKDVPVDVINRAFVSALVTLPRNPFYARHFDLLNPILVSAIGNWQIANEFEAGESESDLRIAFILRSSYANLLTQVAFIVGGLDWVRAVGPDVRRFTHAEGWDKYLENLSAEKAARQSRA